MNLIVCLYSWFENTGDNCLSCATVVPILQQRTCSFVALKQRHVQTYFHILITFLACVKCAHQHVFQTFLVPGFIFFITNTDSPTNFLFFGWISWLIFNSFCCDGSHFGSSCLISVVFLSLILLYDLFASFPTIVFWHCFVLHFYFILFFLDNFSSFCLCAMLWSFAISFYHHYVYLGSITVTFLFVCFLSFHGCMFSGIYLRPGFRAWTFLGPVHYVHY